MDNSPFRIVENKQNDFWVVDERGEAELGTWYIGTFRFKQKAQEYCDIMNALIFLKLK